jgi:hypothetical protein
MLTTKCVSFKSHQLSQVRKQNSTLIKIFMAKCLSLNTLESQPHLHQFPYIGLLGFYKQLCSQQKHKSNLFWG